MTLLIVPSEHTGGDDTQRWLSTRREMFRYELLPWLCGWHEAAALLSFVFVAHSRNETGAGRAEHNYNLGGIRAFSSQSFEAFVRSGLPWRSYRSLRDGVGGYLSTMLGNDARRAACLAYLDHGDGARWYREAILSTGYDNAEGAVSGFERLWRIELDSASGV